MHGNESAENYLETILILSQRLPRSTFCRCCNGTGLQKIQRQRSYEKVARERPYCCLSEGYITLTESGKKIADCIYERHTLLSSWLTRLGVDPKVAAEDACRIEHVISAESFEAIKRHIK